MSLKIEIATAEAEGAAPRRLLEDADEHFQQLGAHLRDAWGQLMDEMSTSRSSLPSEMQIELTLQAERGASWVIVGGGAPATLGVKLTWKQG